MSEPKQPQHKLNSELATGGQMLVEALRRQKVERVFCVPGESYLPALDAFYDTEIEVISARHEGAAAFMAEADGKLTGRPGICFVTRGPGATHASIGVHTAFHDSTPMILFIGQVGADFKDREAFQEVDFGAMFGPIAKWVCQIEDVSRIPEYMARAFQTAMSGRPGPVVVALPHDVLAAEAAAQEPVRFAEPPRAAAAVDDLRRFAGLLSAAERPLIIVGGGGWTAPGVKALGDFALRHEIPVAASFRRQSILDNTHGAYCGQMGPSIDPLLARRVQSADLIIALGARLSELTTSGYTLLSAPYPQQQLIHVHADPDQIGRVYQADLGVACAADLFVQDLPGLNRASSDARRAWFASARAEYEAFSAWSGGAPQTYVDLGAVVSWLSEHLGADALVTNGAGNYAVWVHRYYRYRALRGQLAPTSGAMGYGLPAAIAAKLRFPERDVVAFAGDGCFLMYPQELGTAAQHKANLITLVVNNGTYGTIRMHQERRYPGRVVGTTIENPDFVALARSFGAYGETVHATEDFAAAFARAKQAGAPALLELRVDPLQLTPSVRLKSS